MRNFDDLGVRSVRPYHGRRRRVVDDYGLRGLGDPPQHRPRKIPAVHSRPRALSPQGSREVFGPAAVIVSELLHIGALAETPQKEMLQHGVMQHYHAGLLDSPLVNVAMELVVSHLIQRDVAVFARAHVAVLAQGRQQRRCVIRHPRARRRERREVSHVHAFLRGPNRAGPTPTSGAPSPLATSRSCDIPIESCSKPCAAASSRNRTKYGRDRSAWSDHGGMVISPSNRRCAHTRTAATSSARLSGAAPAFEPSSDSFTSIITSSGLPAASS